MEEKENYGSENVIKKDDGREDSPETEELEEEGEMEEEGGKTFLGECRLHPPMAVNLFKGRGNKAEIVTSQTILGDKAVYLYEFPQCSGEDCVAYWCNVHEMCSLACRHEAECHSIVDGEA